MNVKSAILKEMEDDESWTAEGLAQALDTRVMYIGMALSALKKQDVLERTTIGGYVLWKKKPDGTTQAA